jgi:hypothetical protein
MEVIKYTESFTIVSWVHMNIGDLIKTDFTDNRGGTRKAWTETVQVLQCLSIQELANGFQYEYLLGRLVEEHPYDAYDRAMGVLGK